MKQPVLMALAASATLMVAAPAFAQQGPPAGNPGQGSGSPGAPGVGGVTPGGGPEFGEAMREQARTSAQAENAADQAKLHANENSAVAADADVAAKRRPEEDNATPGATTRAYARQKSQGRVHASDRAKARANSNSAIGADTDTTTTTTAPTPEPR